MRKTTSKPTRSPRATSSAGSLTGDAADLAALVLWLRAENVAVSTVQVGGALITVVPAVLGGSSFDMPTREDSKSLYEQYGGEVLAKAKDAGVFEDDD